MATRHSHKQPIRMISKTGHWALPQWKEREMWLGMSHLVQERLHEHVEPLLVDEVLCIVQTHFLYAPKHAVQQFGCLVTLFVLLQVHLLWNKTSRVAHWHTYTEIILKDKSVNESMKNDPIITMKIDKKINQPIHPLIHFFTHPCTHRTRQWREVLVQSMFQMTV